MTHRGPFQLLPFCDSSNHLALKPEVSPIPATIFLYWPYFPFRAFIFSLFSSLSPPLFLSTSHRFFFCLGLLCLPAAFPTSLCYSYAVVGMFSLCWTTWLPPNSRRGERAMLAKTFPSLEHQMHLPPTQKKAGWALHRFIPYTKISCAGTQLIYVTWRLRLSYFNLCQLVTAASSAAIAGGLYPALQVWLTAHSFSNCWAHSSDFLRSLFLPACLPSWVEVCSYRYGVFLVLKS